MRQAVIDASGVVLNVVELDDGSPWTPPDGCGTAPVPDGIGVAAGWVFAGGTFTDPAPARLAQTLPRTQIGGVFLAAVCDLGWWGWMEQGAAAQAAADKPLDQRYWSTIGKSDVVLASDAKLGRVARAAEAARVASSGQPAPDASVITIAAAMDHGDAMLKAG